MRTDTVVWFQEVLSAPAETQLLGLPADQRFAAEIDGPERRVDLPRHLRRLPARARRAGSSDLVPCAGLTWVGVHPDHRRRGVLTAMMRHHLEQVRDTPGTHVSALHASEPAIYGRYGYGLASLEQPITLSRGATLTAPGLDEAAGTVTTRMATITDADIPQRMHACHLRGVETGAIVGAPEYYERICQSFPEWLRDKEPWRILFAQRDGEDVGFAMFRRERSGSRPGPAARSRSSSSSASPATRLALLRRLVDFDLVGTIQLRTVGAEDPVLAWAGGPRATAGVETYDSLWIRLVDLPEALAARTWSAPCDVVVEVTDTARTLERRHAGGSTPTPTARRSPSAPTPTPTCGCRSRPSARRTSAAATWSRSPGPAWSPRPGPARPRALARAAHRRRAGALDDVLAGRPCGQQRAALDGRVQDLDGVGERHRVASRRPAAFDRGRDLHQAAGVGGDEHVGAGGDDVARPCGRRARGPARGGARCRRRPSRSTARPRRSRAAPGRGSPRAAGAAAPARPGRARGGRRRGRRRSPRAGAARRPGRARRAARRRRGPCPGTPAPAVAEQLGVLLHRRAAAGGVDDDPLDAGGLEDLDQPAGVLAAPRPRGRCAPTARRSSPAPRGTTTSQPSAWSTRAVAAFTPGKNAPCTQPVSIPTTVRRCPVAGSRSGSGSAFAEPRGEPLHRGQRRREPLEQAGTPQRPVEPGPLHAPQRAAQQPQPPRVAGTPRRSGRAAPARARGAGASRSTSARVCSISRSYCTPDGHAVTHAMQPRQASQWPTIASVIGSPSTACCIRWMRPRGESISSPHSTYVGQVGRQNPQCTQSSRSSRSRSTSDRLPRTGPATSRCSGSNWSLTRRIRSSAGTGPQTSTARLTSAGASTTTTVPPCRARDLAQPRRTPRASSAARVERRRPRRSRALARPAGRGQHVAQAGQHERDLAARSRRGRQGYAAPARPAAASATVAADRAPDDRAHPGRDAVGPAADQHRQRRRRRPRPPTARPASGRRRARPRARSSGSTVTHRRTSGSGCSRNTASVITASVPKEPTTSLPRS